MNAMASPVLGFTSSTDDWETDDATFAMRLQSLNSSQVSEKELAARGGATARNPNEQNELTSAPEAMGMARRFAGMETAET
jgi:hypothetical protein